MENLVLIGRPDALPSPFQRRWANLRAAGSRGAIRLAGGARRALRLHWRLYVFEALELAAFMLSACAFAVLLFEPNSSAARLIPNAVARQALFALAMGATATLIIKSPMGKRSGAHFNPACTLTYLRLGKISKPDAYFYMASHFVGAVLGVAVGVLLFGGELASPGVDYVVSVPGVYGTAAAFLAELFMAIVFMSVALWTSNRPALAGWTAYFIGGLIALYLVAFGAVSGVGLNPARSIGSALFADVWTAIWVYVTAPVLGMLIAAEGYVRLCGSDRVLCAKFEPDNIHVCPFLCRFPGHVHDWESAATGDDLDRSHRFRCEAGELTFAAGGAIEPDHSRKSEVREGIA